MAEVEPLKLVEHGLLQKREREGKNLSLERWGLPEVGWQGWSLNSHMPDSGQGQRPGAGLCLPGHLSGLSWEIWCPHPDLVFQGATSCLLTL